MCVRVSRGERLLLKSSHWHKLIYCSRWESATSSGFRASKGKRLFCTLNTTFFISFISFYICYCLFHHARAMKSADCAGRQKKNDSIYQLGLKLACFIFTVGTTDCRTKGWKVRVSIVDQLMLVSFKIKVIHTPVFYDHT